MHALGKTNQSLTTAANRRPHPCAFCRRTQHNSSSLHLRDILLQCEHCSRPSPPLPLLPPPKPTVVDNLQRTGEGRIMASRASRRLRHRTVKQQHKTHGMTCNPNSRAFPLLSPSLGPSLCLSRPFLFLKYFALFPHPKSKCRATLSLS